MASEKPTNPFAYATDPELNSIFDKLVGLKTRVDGQLMKAERMAGLSDNARFMPLTEAKITLTPVQSLREPSSSYHSRAKVPLAKVEEQARKLIADAREHIAAVDGVNVDAIAHNKNLCQQVTDLLNRIGIANSYTTYELPSPRHKTRQTIPHTAGFVNDLNRVCPKSNTYSLKLQIDEYERRLTAYLDSWRKEEIKEKAEADTRAVEKYIAQKPHIIKLLIKTADIDLLTLLSKAEAGQKSGVIRDAIKEAIDFVLDKNKYLRLAYFLEQNRNDWNDGPVEAERGLYGFTIEDKTDQEIYDELNGLVINWEGDGRVFRDCKWNYTVLYSMVLSQLEQLTALLD